jgi:hypothetical protein
MKGITADEVASVPKVLPKGSKGGNSQSQVKTPSAVARVLRSAAASPRSWLAITCAMLAISGGVRFVRDAGYAARAKAARQCPFPLEELPKALGAWRMVSEAELDPEIVRVAGSTDNITRNYADDRTGEVVSVMVQYGPALAVHGHIPDLCYPTAGYTSVAPMREFEVKTADLNKVIHYRGGHFVKKIGGANEYHEVLYSFRFADQWIPDASSQWKLFRFHPSVFKVQLARPVTELNLDTSPSGPLLAEFAQVIEKRLSELSAKTAASDQTTRK